MLRGFETKDNSTHRVFTYRITEKEAYDIINHLKTQNVTGILDQARIKQNLSKHLGVLKGSRFRSILAFPIYVKAKTSVPGLAGKNCPMDSIKRWPKSSPRLRTRREFPSRISGYWKRLSGWTLQEELKIAKTVQRACCRKYWSRTRNLKLPRFQNLPMKSVAITIRSGSINTKHRWSLQTFRERGLLRLSYVADERNFSQPA